jgi:flagellar biosynthesis GTPase FlhF
MSTTTQDIVPDAATAHAPATRDRATRIYRARTVEELIPKIQAELGEDAIVVRRHKGLTGGIGGFFQRPFVEIEARAGTPRIDRYDEDGAASALPPAPEHPAPVLSERTVEEAFRELTPADLIEGAVALGDTAWPAAARVGHNDNPFAAALAEAETAVLPTEREHRQPPAATHATAATYTTAATHATALTHATTHVDAGPASAAPAPAGQAPRGRARGRIEASLQECGVGEPFARELIETAAAHVLPIMPARSSLARAVHASLCQRIPTAAALPVGSATIAVVGPGGSGKTACCDALLDAYRERSTLPAACARILAGQAREQLAALISPHVPQPTAVSTPQVTRALRSAREEGLLLLDLPSLSPADRGSIRAVAALLQTLKPDRVILALPATMGAKPVAQLLEAMRPLGASALAITHADETDQLGVAVEAACAFGLAPEYLLDRGPSRGGLTPIDPTYLADRLLPS